MMVSYPSSSSLFQSTSSARRTTASIWLWSMMPSLFQSTSSARRTTSLDDLDNDAAEISIHVLREEDDFSCCWLFLRRLDFNPRPPRGGRRWRLMLICGAKIFQSTSSARRTTYRHCDQRLFRRISIHVLREEDDRYDVGKSV